ncbi:hypothetical protein GLOTRDRAFT_31887 [Gloeophyllum trabeum ATCC 11539]|uniref:NUDE domain-containing protein n=1 Tax=Gloeophyllum trabeum (strain ATCC 11539 / FP-39264 / Madison 617) TaxID=670483 RepID=S7S491_GLOTA|nr:uncharacterized protein GLOTRDRAFT_31887 [Gloeophyllum trabeum ATCC 11539]EPQ60699.1 hypothetical protein GLOTRDRAFT_31887 [Gloeophyllum trabeum ATCC 11539]
MTAVLSATDPLRRDRIMGHDDNQINFSTVPTDWRAKYNEVADMLAETRAELEDFQNSSKELEEELERELERTEKAQQELKVKAARAESERDEWKNKFMSLQTTHNTTTTSLQRELDTLRQEHQHVKVQLRELEMGNDDLERNERAISSSLADIESKYSRVLEEKILLEHELLDKAHLEEECQRLRDELRDANEEISVIKDQLAAVQARQVVTELSTPPSSAPASDENLLSTAPPADLQLSDLSPPCLEPSAAPPVAPPSPPAEPDTPKQTAQRSPFNPTRSIRPPGSSSSPFARSTTLPTLYTRGTPKTPTSRPGLATRTSSTSTTSITTTTGTASRSKGVQMVSEMRARVKNLEQKIHTRVPRLRMGSVTGKNPVAESTSSPIASTSSPVPSTSSSTLRSETSRRSAESYDSQKSETKRVVSPADSTGWVLIMEDSPTPVKEKDKERRRSSSPLRPLAPSAFRSPKSSLDETESFTNTSRRSQYALSKSTTGIRRPQSRLSDGRTSASTATTASSIHTPLSSRPCTPTFLPLPTSSIHSTSNLKKSVGPGAKPPSQPKRSSLGHSPVKGGFSFRERPYTMPAPPRPESEASSPNTEKELPRFPQSQSNVTLRPPSKFAMSSSLLSQSRIGRPSGGRRSGGGDLSDDPSSGDRTRGRSGSTVYGRSAA